MFLNKTYSGRHTQSVVDKFKPILKKALNNYINELMSDKIKAALNTEEEKKTKRLHPLLMKLLKSLRKTNLKL